MKIFVDSADIEEIRQAYQWGIADGVTTNPSLLKKAVDKKVAAGEDLDLASYITEILEVAEGTPVSLEVTATSAEKMVEQGKNLYHTFNSVAGNVYIKIPVNPSFSTEDTTQFDGIRAIKELKAEGIPVNCTLVFTPEQALLAAKAGADFVSPFAGRVDDDLRSSYDIFFEKTEYYPQEGLEIDEELVEDNGVVSGVDLVEQCVDLINYYGFSTEVLAASLRNTRQVREAALVGADIATLPFGVVKAMLEHHKTYEGMELFTRDTVAEYDDLCNG
ncbi:MAG: transaldolase family protein [Chlamydiota bacterium]